MANETPNTNEISKFIEMWASTATKFWKDLAETQDSPIDAAAFVIKQQTASAEDDSDRYKSYRTWETSLNNMMSMLRLMSAPENQEAMLKSATSFSETMVQATGDYLDYVAEFQSQLVHTLGKISDHTTAYNYDDLDHRAFESFRELYKSELQKYLYIPKVGLPRQLHEQMSQLVDRSNIFYSHLAELIFLFILPFEKTTRDMQDQTKQMLERGEFPADGKHAYNEWIKTLEGHFMDLLKSTEYTRVLNNTIGSLASYKDVKNKLIGVYLKELQVPTNKEMDEVYRDIYQMKKTIKAQTKQITELKKELKALQA